MAADTPVRLVRAFVTLVGALAIAVGIPVALVAMVGWPLPTKMPDWHEVYWAARQGNIPAEFVVKALACVVWVAWAQFVWALAWELCVNLPRLDQGRPQQATPLAAAPVSRLARRIVSAVILFTTVAATPAATVAAPPLTAFSSASGAPPPDLLGARTMLVHDESTVTRTAPRAAAWTAVEGDALWDIAEQCLGDASRVDDILDCNPYLDAARPLRAGQVIELPAHARIPAERSTPAATHQGAAPASSPEAVTADHVVTAGDTLWEVIEDHYGSVDAAMVNAVAQANGIADPNLIVPGRTITLPDLDAPSRQVAPLTTGTGYVVVEGDTLWDVIHGHYGHVDATMVDAVAQANGIADPNLIFPGQTISLPDLDSATNGVDDRGADHDASESASDEGSAPTAEPRATEPSATTIEGEPRATAPAIAEPTLPAPPSVPSSLPPPTTVPVVPAPSAPQPSRETVSSAPNVTAGVSESAAAVDARDAMGSRWLFGGAVASSLALGGAWVTLRHLRHNRRRWLNITAPTALANPHAAEDDPEPRQTLATLADLVDGNLVTGSTVRGVLLGQGAKLRVRSDAPPPEGWEADGRTWRRADAGATAPRVLSPAVVTVGTSADTGDVVVDLATAGTVSVTGDRVAVDRLICSMLWELSSCPLGQPVDLYVVGLACLAEQHTTNRARLVSLDDAVTVAAQPGAAGDRVQVFLVDPFADDEAPAALAELVAACTGGSGRAVVVAGPCEQPTEEINVPSTQRCIWDELILDPPQLTESVDVELSRMLAAVNIGRRSTGATTAVTEVADPQAEALRLTATMLDNWSDAGEADDHPDPGDGELPEPAHLVGDLPGLGEPVTVDAASGVDVVAAPEVLLTVCGETVGAVGHPVTQLTAIPFVLAAAGRPMKTEALCELTGYAPKSLSSVFTTSHPLIERESGALCLRDHVWTDHQWATECVRQLANAMNDNPENPDVLRWVQAVSDALRSIEQAPYAVVPAVRERARATASAWGWVDDFPADVPARAEAETAVAEAALAFSELWLTLPAAHSIVRPDELAVELCRLAGVVPFANVIRQIRPAPWVSGAEHLLAVAAEVAGDDERTLARVQQTARAMAAREQLIASSELAEALGL